jgi:hypothetical protein
MKDKKKDLVDEILLIDIKRGQFIHEVLFDNKYHDMNRILEKLFPHMRLVCFMESSTNINKRRIKKMLGNIKTYYPIYAINECIFGYDINNSEKYIFDARKAYFEFISIDDNSLHSMRTVTENKMYNVIITSASTGFARYITNEIVQITDKYNESPCFNYVCNINEIHHNINDNILTLLDIEKILMKYYDDIVDYCYRVDNGVMKIYIELDELNYFREYDKINDVRIDIKNIKITKIFMSNLKLKTEVRILKPWTFNKLCKLFDTCDDLTFSIDKNISKMNNYLKIYDMLKQNIIYWYH